MLRISLLTAFLISTVVSCGGSSKTTTVTPEPDPFCSSATPYPSGLTITGKAVYEYRVDGNGAVSGTPNPIREAEIAVFDASNTIIQCGTTDDSGNFSVKVPNPATSLTLKVNSRISNSLTKAYVLNNPSDMDHFFISAAIDASADTDLGTITAPATDTLEGAAFNILDKVLTANTYLYTQTLNCNGTFAVCTPFTGIPLVKVFWTKGVNPGSYFNSGAVSFYVPGTNELYILGGEDGDVDNSDTDHFDNSIIVHEYGHFIEDNFSKTNSPGGSHTGDSIDDARLAWGEGWANFFQAAVLNKPLYLDTVGTPDGTPDIYFDEDLETPQHDIPTTLGEGNFREFSITRLLWDAIDDGSLNSPANDDDTVTTPFSELWTVFTNPTTGFKYEGNHFRNVGLFHYIHDNSIGAGTQDWSSLRTSEKQRGDLTDYSRGVASSVSACTAVSIKAKNIPGWNSENGSASNSNQFDSNDFYEIYHGGGNFVFELDHSSSSLPSSDLDVYIYPEVYQFGTTTPSAKSVTAIDISTTLSGVESITKSLPAGYYMINIRVNTGNGNGTSGNTANYTMKLNGGNLCPN